MIAIGAMALFTGLFSENEWVEAGVEFVNHILERHVNDGRWRGLRRGVLLEALDETGAPWRETDGAVICDPGHSIEFAGLSARFAAAVESAGLPLPFDDEFHKKLYGILTTAFGYGWNKRVGGICKTFDARSGNPVNSDMPWWPLPETIRATALLRNARSLAAARERDRLTTIVNDCAAAFKKNFVNENVHFMAYQTVSDEGIPVSVVPATPDADPGYHTGLSLIDYLNATA